MEHKRHHYTPKQQARLDELMRGACEAEELFDLDELEEFADRKRREEQNDE